MPAHIHPARFWFAYWLDMSWSIVSPGSMSRHESTRCPPCTESPFAPSGRYPSGGGLSIREIAPPGMHRPHVGSLPAAEVPLGEAVGE